MVQLIAFLLILAALVILVVQNLNPLLGLVVLGQSTVQLPLAVWLLGAIAAGAICTLVIYQLVPTKRAYRPMGKRLNDPPEPSSRFINSPENTTPNRFQSEPPGPTSNRSRDPYDSDWHEFKAPEQWEDWGQQTAQRVPEPDYRDRPARAMEDIESGWGDDNYETSGRFASRRYAQPDAESDRGWDNQGDYADDGAEPPSTRTYEEGWLYGNDAATEEPEAAPPAESGEDVYDANYRVIIPPYDAKDS